MQIPKSDLISLMIDRGYEESALEVMGEREMFTILTRDRSDDPQPMMQLAKIYPPPTMLEQFIREADVRVAWQLLHVDPKENLGATVNPDVFLCEITFPMLKDDDPFRLISSGAAETTNDAFAKALKDFGLMAKRGVAASGG